MAKSSSRQAEGNNERRLSGRILIDQDVRYKRLGKKKNVTEVSVGKVLNMSSKGLLFYNRNCSTGGGACRSGGQLARPTQWCYPSEAGDYG